MFQARSVMGFASIVQREGLTYPLVAILRNTAFPARMEPATGAFVPSHSEVPMTLLDLGHVSRMFCNITQIQELAKLPDGEGLQVWIPIPAAEQNPAAPPAEQTASAGETKSVGDGEVAGGKGGDEPPKSPASEPAETTEATAPAGDAAGHAQSGRRARQGRAQTD